MVMFDTQIVHIGSQALSFQRPLLSPRVARSFKDILIGAGGRNPERCTATAADNIPLMSAGDEDEYLCRCSGTDGVGVTCMNLQWRWQKICIVLMYDLTVRLPSQVRYRILCCIKFRFCCPNIQCVNENVHFQLKQIQFLSASDSHTVYCNCGLLCNTTTARMTNFVPTNMKHEVQVTSTGMRSIQPRTITEMLQPDNR